MAGRRAPAVRSRRHHLSHMLSRPARTGGRPSILGAIGLDLPPLEAGRPGDPGLFGPGSEVWRIGRERVLLAGGAAALLLQVAHPLVAAGVAEHSDFPRRAFDRLRSTLDATLRITFGDTEQAEGAVAQVRATHDRVRGSLASAIGPYPAGTPYDAADPELALWVHATLVQTALDTFQRFVRPLTAAEQARYYRDTKAFGELFGATDEVMPRTYQDFRAYFDDMIWGPRLAVGDAGRALAEDILRPPLPAPAAAAGPLHRVLSTGLLPPRIRSAFGFPWRARDRSVFSGLAASSRTSVPLLPAALRFWPHYRTATRRVGRRL
jgi:uncharacterized protein (DUF2236 family)